jgi:excisionase family DNA binding protein
MPKAQSEPTLPSEGEVERAREVRRAIEQQGVDRSALRIQIAAAGDKATTIDLPPVVMRLLMNILKETAAGHAVTLIPYHEEITTQQAADLLNVSRPYLVSMIDNGTLPARMVGDQRRLPLKDVLAYREQNRAERLATLNELTALDQELGLF